MAKKKKKDRLTASDIIALFAVCGVIGGIASKDLLMTVVMVAILIFIGWLETRKTAKQHKGIDTMNGLEFEGFCAQQLAKSRRFKTVETTPPSGDFGADIVAVDVDGVRWVFQCKRYAQRLDILERTLPTLEQCERVIVKRCILRMKSEIAETVRRRTEHDR